MPQETDLPQPPAPMTRSVRRIRIELGRSAFSYERIVERGAAGAPAPRRALAPLVAGTAIGGLAVVAAVLAGANDLRAAGMLARPAAVSVDVPPPARAATPRRAVAEPVSRRASRPGRARVLAVPVPAAATDDAVIGFEPPAAGFATQEAAVRAALATGTMQEWSEAAGEAGGDVRGFVVVGTGEAARGCRSVSILTRTGAASEVRRFQQCGDEAYAGSATP